MADNTPDQPPGVSGTIGPSTSQALSTSKRSSRSKLRNTIKGLFSGSKTPSERPTTPTPPPTKASNTIKRHGIGNDASDMLVPGKLLSKRAEKVPRGSAETNDRKIALLDLGIGAINALCDVSQIPGLAMNQSNPVGQALEKVTAVLGTLKQMMENRSAWETLLITLDDHQLVLNRQLALLKKDHLDVDPTSPVLDPIKRYSTTLEEILVAIIKESGLADRDGHGGGRWETVKNFSSKFINAGSEKDQIQGYDRKVSVAMNQLNLALVLYISDKVQDIGHRLVSNEEENMLAKLKITDLECGSLSRRCMEGTRQDILEKIKEWTTDLDAPNILWLKGHPGVGKSAIATDVVEHLRASGRLGSGFFFHRQNATIMTTSLLWCTVAYDLARKYPTIRKHIIAALNAHELSPTTPDVDKLFLHLIHEPMVESETIPEDSLPIIVVDALDECGGLKSRRSEHRRSLMKTLTSWSRLPSKFKLIVTSRSEIDIELVFSATNHRLVEILAGQTVEPQSSKDIQIFITGQLRVQVMNEYEESLPPNYGTQVAEDLAERAAGLFIWAETVINFISLGHPQQRLEQVLKGSGTGDMNGLYSQILRSSFGQPTKEEITNFCAVVGTIILAKVPLSVLSLQQLLSLDELAVRVVCNGLRSVLDSRDVLRFHHQSFVDFLMDPERSPHQFRFERNRESRNLTLACLRVMKNVLIFNICDIPSSYHRNSDVPDLEARVEKCIPPYVSYSSRFWANHLAETVFDVEVFSRLQHFMQNQFLFWLEILSLTKRVNIASSMLLLLVDWIKTGQRDDIMASDMRKFVAGFGSVISRSVPHIYLSALPFSPRNSAVSKQYRQQFPRTIAMKTGGLINWPVMQNVLSGHSGRVLSVAFSPDGTRIVSGSYDMTIRVWDAETGEVVAGPLSHGGGVYSVAFSPDGTRIVSVSLDMTIRVWDAETGERVALFVHREHVTSAAFSPDGAHLVSVSWDKIIRVWDAETGEAVAAPFEEHSRVVNSVTISQDRTRIVYGSDDETIRVWDAETGEMVAGPFEGHSIIVQAAAASPDGTHVASGCNSKTIRIWDVETGEVVAGQFSHSEHVTSLAFSPDGARLVSGSWDKTIRVWGVEADAVGAGHADGHTKAITSIAFSRDGKRIVSSSEDKTIRVWDADIGEMVAGPFEGHSSTVNSVAISPDGTRIVSGSNDQTILVWDAEAGEVVTGPLSHNGTVKSVAISLDGTRIASGSDDKTTRVWDAKTGEMVAGPFEGQSPKVNSVAFSPNGTRIVSAGERKVRVWNVETGEAVTEPFEGHQYSVTAVAFSLDGTRIVSGSHDRTIRVWDTETGEVVAGPFEGHVHPITSVAFSPDGTYVVSGSQDNTICVWNIEAGKVIAGPWEVHSNWVRSVTFSPDGKRLVSASGTTIWAWDFLIDDSTHLDYNLPPFARSGMQDGWILGANSELLLWVPPALRDGLCWPNKTLAIGNFIKTTLDLAHFVHGDSWSQCKG